MPILTPHKNLPAIIFTTGKFEYVAFSAVSAPIALLTVTGMAYHPEAVSFPFLFLVLALIFFVYLWLFSFELKITPLALSFVNLFNKRRSIRIEDLAKVEIVTGGSPPYCMIFYPKEGVEVAPIRINIKPVKRDDLQKLAIFLPKVAPNAQYDERFLMMAEGKMPSMFFKHQ